MNSETDKGPPTEMPQRPDSHFTLPKKNVGKATKKNKGKDSAGDKDDEETTTVKKAPEVRPENVDTNGVAFAAKGKKGKGKKAGKKDAVENHIEAVLVAKVVEPETPVPEIEHEESAPVAESKGKKLRGTKVGSKKDFIEVQELKESENLVAAGTYTKEKLCRGKQTSPKEGTEKPAKTSEEPLPNDQIESSLPAVPVVETKEKRSRGRQAKTPVEAPNEASIEAQEAAPAKRGRGKKTVVSAVFEVDSEEEAVEEVKEPKAKRKKAHPSADSASQVASEDDSPDEMAGTSGGDVALFHDLSTAAYNNRQRTTSSDKTIDHAFEDIGTMADSLALPKAITDRAKYIFKDVHDRKLLKGRSIHLIASACLHIACRQGHRARSFKEISAASNIGVSQIGKCHKQILKALETSVDIITIADFIPRFCCNLGLPINVQTAASHIGRRAMELDLVPGRSPISVAAAAIYMASQASEKKLSKKKIRDIAGVADVTIGQSYELMYPRASELFPHDFKLILSQLPQR